MQIFHCTTATSLSVSYPSLKSAVALFTSFFLFSPDPSLTAENVSSVLETVRGWDTVRAVLDVSYTMQHLIGSELSDGPQWRLALVQWWLLFSPTASWTWLAGRLYRREESTALRAVSQYIPKEAAGNIIF